MARQQLTERGEFDYVVENDDRDAGRRAPGGDRRRELAGAATMARQ